MRKDLDELLAARQRCERLIESADQIEASTGVNFLPLLNVLADALDRILAARLVALPNFQPASGIRQ